MNYGPINPKMKSMLHGADYNPEQWIDYPGIWDEDIRMMQLAKCNTMSVGIFSWSALEREEGVFTFEWLDKILDKFAENGQYAIIATPSGARPAWLSQKYPEVLRVAANRTKNLHGARHNHCYSSPVYREKIQLLNRKLAERYKDHKALLMWHISNEYGGDCHCDLCQENFRSWLKERYNDDLEALNRAWWTSFWSHTYTDWSQIESPAPQGEHMVHGHNLDWKRFVTYMTTDFMKHEIKALREFTPTVPVTTNFMEFFNGLDYWKMASEIDIVSWDNYPRWHGQEDEVSLACRVGLFHDINRSLKGGKPFMLMESTPSLTNWQEVAKLKRPGMHILSSLQAVAHGSDTVQYFQWRKSRGSSEKFHGAVVDHCGHEHTRVFKEVARLGEILKQLDDVVGTSVSPEVGMIFDWDNRWVIQDLQGYKRDAKSYEETIISHYRPFWEKGIPVDVIDMEQDFSKYKVLVAPMLHMVKPGVAKRIEAFVKKGGTFITTYASGVVDEHDLCFLGGFPGPLRSVLGIWAEETDSLYDEDVNTVSYLESEAQGVMTHKAYKIKDMCDLIHCETAKPLAIYDGDFYQGQPALTVNQFGQGQAYYIAFRNHEDFERDFYQKLIGDLSLKSALLGELPEGVTAQTRYDAHNTFVFVMNFTNETKQVQLAEGVTYEEVTTKAQVSGEFELPAFGVKILKA